MRILCISDIIDPLVYSDNIKERFKDVDLILGAGDLPMPYLGFISTSLNRPVLFVFGNHNLMTYDQFRHGTSAHHPIDHMFSGKLSRSFREHGETHQFLPRTFGSTYIGGKTMRHKGLLLAGMGGSIRYNNGKNQYTQRRMNYKLAFMFPRLLWNRVRHGRWVDVFLTHSPPYKLNDGEDPPHNGFKAFRWFIKIFKPRYLLHGHIHLYDINCERMIQYKHTDIINVYGHYILDIDVQSLSNHKNNLGE